MELGRANGRRKIGLALGSGAARGLAHIGVLKVLEREDIPIDMIAGTSMGALIGAFYAYGQSLEKMERLAIELGAKRLRFLFDPGLPKSGLLRGKPVEKALKGAIDDAAFSDLKIPFACVATDIDSGEEVVIRDGLVWDAIRASSSIPVIFDVLARQDRYLVDGGLVNPVPVSVLKSMGADITIAVNVIPRHEIPGKEAPRLFAVVMQTLYVSGYQVLKASLAGADIVIEPKQENIGYADFHKAREAIRQGELAAEQLLPVIKSRLKALAQVG